MDYNFWFSISVKYTEAGVVEKVFSKKRYSFLEYLNSWSEHLKIILKYKHMYIYGTDQDIELEYDYIMEHLSVSIFNYIIDQDYNVNELNWYEEFLYTDLDDAVFKVDFLNVINDFDDFVEDYNESYNRKFDIFNKNFVKMFNNDLVNDFDYFYYSIYSINCYNN